MERSSQTVEIKSPYNYTVELDYGRRQHFHANCLQKYNLKIDEVDFTFVGLSSFTLDNADCSWAVIYDVSNDTFKVILIDDCELPSPKLILVIQVI